ncbi:MAG TPA: cellulase family glycosylhydrolase [Terriglobales bacterium]|nr:cellulase family glycosylhydrolase [Terriglobales bacterium]
MPAARAAHLRRGINLSHWFAQAGDPSLYNKERLATFVTAEDIALIKSMGFDNVRLGVNPQPMFRRNQADRIPVEYLGYLDAAVKMILDHKLAVVIDIHPEEDFKEKLATDDSFVEQFADFWRALAQHYSSHDPEMVFFEILNEPEVRDRYRWSGMQSKLVEAIREGAPRHTIIAAGARWSDDDDLVFLEPLRDTNIIYNFHFYEPHVFTHQGATWGVNFWHDVQGLAYPSSPESAEKAAASVPDPVNRLAVLRYGAEHWDAARMDLEMSQAAEWAKRWNVPLICNEFGVFRPHSNPQDRAAWIHDVRSALEKYGIGWAMWDYSQGFGVVNKVDGHPVPDDLTVKALGLKP